MKYREYWPYAIIIVLAVFFIRFNQAGLKSGVKQNGIIQPPKEIARVLKVIDGDTIEVNLNSKTERIRLIGIDSPEVLDERRSVQCFGKEASSKAREILNGKTINLESDPTQGERDEYGRLLRYVFFDSLSFNKFMIREGYAYEYTFKGNFYKYQSEFVQAEKEARKNKIGLWSKCKQS